MKLGREGEEQQVEGTKNSAVCGEGSWKVYLPCDALELVVVCTKWLAGTCLEISGHEVDKHEGQSGGGSIEVVVSD